MTADNWGISMEDSPNSNPYDKILNQSQHKREEAIEWTNITKEKIIRKWADIFLKFHDNDIEETITNASSRF